MSIMHAQCVVPAAKPYVPTDLIAVASQNYSHLIVGGTAVSGIRIATDRDVDEQQGASNYASQASWLELAGTPADYEVRATLNSGSLNAGSAATGSYLALTTSREWYCQDLADTQQTANLTIAIREIADIANNISFTCTLSADAPSI